MARVPEVALIVLRSEILSGMCAKLRTVAAGNNKDHPTRSLSCHLSQAQSTVHQFHKHC